MRKWLATVCLLWAMSAVGAEPRPNIVYILCDDLGYGDVKCFNATGKIATPCLDRLAGQGVRFSDAHSGSSVCTPTRYGILTGRYAWRSRLQSGVLGGLSPRLIEPGRMTLAELLKQHGYQTVCIGKWHLGMDWVKRAGKTVSELGIENPEQVNNVDYSRPIALGPNSLGFDSYFGISASLDMVPYTFIENDRVAKLPTAEKKFPLMFGRAESFSRIGPAAADFEAADVLPVLTQKAVEAVRQLADGAVHGKPFFLYLPLNAPHTPIAPSPDWQGKSNLNPYGDFVMQTDWSIGQVIETIDKLGLADNTLLIVTSDNGCSPSADFEELAAKGHYPSDVFRGYKADIYDGGHRIPLLVRWPPKIKPATQSDQLVCLTDFMATCADILEVELPGDAGEDSVSLLPALEGKAGGPLREAIVHHSINGSFSIRQGNWKLELCPGSGGCSAPRPDRDDTRLLPPIQLYDLRTDIAERHNVQEQHPDVVARLTRLLEKYVADGRSTPGPPQKNTVAVDIWKAGKDTHQPLRKRASAQDDKSIRAD